MESPTHRHEQMNRFLCITSWGIPCSVTENCSYRKEALLDADNTFGAWFCELASSGHGVLVGLGNHLLATDVRNDTSDWGCPKSHNSEGKRKKRGCAAAVYGKGIEKCMPSHSYTGEIRLHLLPIEPQGAWGLVWGVGVWFRFLTS